MAEWKPDQVLNAKGLSSPMPILKTKKLLKEMKPGQILKIQGNDLQAFASRSGDEYLGEVQVARGSGRMSTA